MDPHLYYSNRILALCIVFYLTEIAAGDYWTRQSEDPSFAGYQLTEPITCATYDFGIIADMDEASKLNKSVSLWTSYLLRGNLSVTYNPQSPCNSTVTIDFDYDHNQTLTSGLNEKDRGMELSALQVFNHRLMTCDDRTGVVFDIPSPDTKNPVPFVILNDGNGTIPKGFKCEWETVKDGYLYAGSHGKLLYPTKPGDITTDYSQWVKRISPDGVITNYDWRDKFNKMRDVIGAKGVDGKGYVVHESACWDDKHGRWVFLPRQVSSTAYDPATENCFGSNIMVFADDDFNDITVRNIGKDTDLHPDRGFSSFKFIPNTNNELIVALKSQECKTIKDPVTKEVVVQTFIMAFSIDGTIILPERPVGKIKYEGIEFL